MTKSPAAIIWWKEVRSVLPVWGVAMVTLLVPAVVPRPVLDVNPDTWAMIAFASGSLAVSIVLFTREFSDRTLIWQMALPQSRMTPFWRKGSTAVILQLPLAVLFLVLNSSERGLPGGPLAFSLFASVVAITSASFWSLVLKHSTSSVVVALGAPLFVVLGVFSLLEWLFAQPGGQWMQKLDQPTLGYWLLSGLWLASAIASGLGAIFVWRRIQLKGDAVAISGIEVSVMSRLFQARTFARRPIWLALLRKELGLLRYVYWLAALFVAAAVAFIIADLALEKQITAALSEASRPASLLWWQGVIRGFASGIFVLMLGLTPLMCGAMAFAEERQFGNHAWQLCQPVTATQQWLIKLGTAGAVSLAFGLLLPAAVALAFESLRTGELISTDFASGARSQAVAAHVMLFGLSAWAASWSQNTITAIMKTFLALIAFMLLHTQLMNHFGPVPYYSPFAVPPTTWPVTGLVLAVGALMATVPNHRSLTVAPRHWLTQCALLVGAVVIAFYLGLKDDGRFYFN